MQYMFLKIKKIHKIVFLFIVIFLIGIYCYTLYIGNIMDQKTDTNGNTVINNTISSDKEATQIN